MIKNKKRLFLIVSLIILFVSAFDQIGNSFRVITTMNNGSDVYMIFKNDSNQELLYDSGILSLNGQNLDNTDIKSIPESEIPLTTLFLVDITKTVLYSETARITETAETFSKNPVFSSSGRSRYFLQTFGNVVSQVTGPTEDPISLVTGIKFEDSTSDYYYALSEAVDFMENRINNGYIEKQQIIIFTDASRFSETSISESQLKDKLRKAGIPIYGIVLYNTNTEIVNREDSDRLLSLAEASGGKIFVPKDYSESTTIMTNEIIRDIISCYVSKAIVNDDISRDARGNYAISLSIFYQENNIAEISSNASINLPELPTETPVPTETQEAIETIEPNDDSEITDVSSQTSESNQTDEQTDNEDKEDWMDKKTELFGKEFSNKFLLFSALGIFLIAILILIILISNKKKKKKIEKQQKTYEENLRNNNVKTMVAPMIPSVNVSLNRIGSSGAAPIQAKLWENEEVIFGRTAGNGIIGLDDDDTISAVHFKLIYMNGFVFIEDMASSNGVILNGSKLTQRAKLNDGDHLLLGRITYQVQITSPNISVVKRG